MSTYTIAIVGLGSRGLSLLEQFIALIRQHPGGASPLSLHLDLFDPQPPGSGLHRDDLPDYLMLNTMAGQLSAFSTASPATQPPGPTFLDWCHRQDLRLDARGHVDPDGQGRPVAFADFVPRRLLGRYLQASYQWLLEHGVAPLQGRLTVRHYPEQIVSAQPMANGSAWQLRSATGTCRQYDALFVTTGHAPTLPVEPVAPGERVAIEGLGLSAMDSLAALTQGRGGRYVADASLAGWRYLPSGREPRIYLYSRSGLPFHARPQGYDARRQAWPRRYFTGEAIDRLRQQAPGGQLDFARDLLPLIEDEMRAVFAQASVQAGLGKPEQASAFEPRQWTRPQRWQGAGFSYAAWLRQWLEQDLLRSRLGPGHPLTQALEVWRNYRDLLRRAADHGGLLADSTAEFYSRFAAVSNRLVGGPQAERYEDLLALLDAGVVQVLPPSQAVQEGGRIRLQVLAAELGSEQPQTLEVDRLIRARNTHSGLSQLPAGGCRSLLASLLQQGVIHCAHGYPADGVAVDPLSRALRRDGSPQPRLWLLGPAVEGSTFYNHYVPTPDPHCLAPLQARQAVQACLDSLTTTHAMAC